MLKTDYMTDPAGPRVYVRVRVPTVGARRQPRAGLLVHAHRSDRTSHEIDRTSHERPTSIDRHPYYRATHLPRSLVRPPHAIRNAPHTATRALD